MNYFNIQMNTQHKKVRDFLAQQIHRNYDILFILLGVLFLSLAPLQAQKIDLDPTMVSLLNGSGEPGMLVDEQILAGDPKNGQGGNPTQAWFTGWGGENHPASASIQLDNFYHIYEIYLRDINGMGNFTISYGTPGNWTELTTYGCDKYLEWVKINANIKAEYLLITIQDQGANISEMVLYGVVDGDGSGGGGNGGGTTPPIGFTGDRVMLSPSMITNEVGRGDPKTLVDEQQTAGDPAEGQGGNPSEHWFLGWGSRNHPGHAYVDLGEDYDLSKVFLYDINGTGNFVIWTGEPGNWEEIATHNCGKYKEWVSFQIDRTTRYIRFSKMEQDANIAEVVCYGIPSDDGNGGGGTDTTPPAAVMDLSAIAEGANTVHLRWSAPGDDGNTGTASSYDVRYSNNPITATNFGSAMEANLEPTPTASGDIQSMTLSGMDPGTTYYFAMKATDDAGNTSNISNITLATTETDGSGPGTGGTPGKIEITPAMMTSENGKGDPTKLVDEQTLAGDPASSTGGMPTTTFFAGWGNGNYPAIGYIDLEQEYDINTIYLRDVNDIGQFEVYAGSPGNWQLLFTDPMTGYLAWNEHEVSVRTRYVRFSMTQQGANVSEVVLYGIPVNGGGGDTSAPMAIQDLQTGEATSSSIALSWTASGDDGVVGTATSYDIRYSTTPITATNFNSAMQFGNAPVPTAAGTQQSVIITGLEASSTYFFAIKTLDEVPNTSDISNIVTGFTPASGGGGDAIPPNPIANLNAGFPNATSIRLNWTATGDNGDIGTAASYELRYSTNIITTANFAQATQAMGVPQPLEAGTDQQAVVNGLQPNTTYYFAMKARDASGNISPMSNIASETTTENNTAPSAGFTMEQLIGINAFFDDPPEKYSVAGFIREYVYAKWYAYDVQNVNTNIQLEDIEHGFNPSYAGGANMDAYYQEVNSLGITVAPSYQEGFMWLVNNVKPDLVHKPARKDENASDPWSYRDHASFMYQMAARYGSTPVPDNTLLLRNDQQRLTGMNLVSYFENWNEHDRWWQGPHAQFSPEEYAAMTSADYDGHMGTMQQNSNVKFGMITADPNAKMVMSGLAHLEYYKLEDMKRWFDQNRTDPNYRKYPLDVINIHRYSNDAGQQHAIGHHGVSPEEDDLKGNMEALVRWVRENMPEISEVWITEFGYDTNPASPQHAPSFAGFSHKEVQAQWLVRSYLAIAAAGVDRAAMYMLRDVADNGGGVFQTCGLVSSKESGWQPKPSWWYVYTMKNHLTGMRYSREIPSGNNNVWIYEFEHTTNGSKAYAVWCPTSSGTTVNGYSLNVGGANSARLVELKEGKINGDESLLNVNNGTVNINVSERPVFVIVE